MQYLGGIFFSNFIDTTHKLYLTARYLEMIKFFLNLRVHRTWILGHTERLHAINETQNVYLDTEVPTWKNHCGNSRAEDQRLGDNTYFLFGKIMS